MSFAFVRHQRVLLFFLYAAIAMAFLASISSDIMHPMIVDYLSHVSNITRAKMALAEGQFPLRVAPLENFDWRYPLYQFYSPSGYLFAGLVFRWLTPDNPMTAYLLTLWFFIILGGIYMNRLAYWLVKSRPAALLASIAYLASPYYLIVINHFAGFSEAIALGIVPALLYYTMQLYSHPTEKKTLLQTALACYLLVTTHITTFMYTSIFAAILLLLVTLKNYRHCLNLISVGLSYVFGCLLAMWYLAPAVSIQKYVNVNSTINANGFSSYHLTLANLLTPAQGILNILPAPDSIREAVRIIQPNIGIPMLLAFGICVYIFFTKSKLENARAAYWLPSLFIIYIFSIFAAWSPINIWVWLPSFLTAGQYCWRIMSQSIWIGSLLLAVSVGWLFNNTFDKRHLLLGICLIFMTASPWLPIVETRFHIIDPAVFFKGPMRLPTSDAYVMDYQKSMQFVPVVSDVSLDYINKDQGLVLGFPYPVEPSLLSRVSKPSIFLDGNVAADNPVLHQPIAIVLNGAIVATYMLHAGPFHWEIPLRNLKNGSALSLEFRNTKLENKKIYLPAKKMILASSLNPREVLNLHQVQPYCKQEKDTTVCRFMSSPFIRLVMLPILYYPDLLAVKINGKPAAYSSVLTRNYLFATVNPVPGVLNTIEVKFRGLVWANSLSAMAWGLWILIFLFLAARSVISINAK